MPSEKRKPIVVAIDGPAGAGKSTVARLLAEKLGVPYLDTGSIYRAIAWMLNCKAVPPDDEAAVEKALRGFSVSLDRDRISVGGTDVTEAIRTAEIDKIVSPISALKCVRDSILSVQRAQAENGLVADGRDIGTVVFPDADLKIFLTASAEERARRRYKERVARGCEADYAEILKQVNERDMADINRAISPLRPAQGSVILDTTTMTLGEVVDVIASLALELKERSGN